MKHARIALIPALAATVALAGCGPSSSSKTAAGPANANTPSNSVASTPGSTPSSGGTTAATDCPTSNTRSFAKTRFVADLGLAAGSFHRYILKPYQAGSFTKGTHGRTLALVKAGATAALDAKLLKNATENVKGSPALCKALYKPMTELSNKLGDLKGEVTSGNLTSVAGIEGLVSQVTGAAKSSGIPITETSK